MSLGLIVAAVTVLVLAVTAFVMLRSAKQSAASTRASMRIPIELAVRVRADGRELEMTTVDISRGGLCLAGDLRSSAGQPVELELTLPGYGLLAVHGVVRWAQRGRLGVLFDLQDRRRVAVGDWIENRSTVSG
jgi:hypothetical protein